MKNDIATAKRVRRIVRTLWLALGAPLAIAASVSSAEAATITVTTKGAPVNGKCSLTQAIEAAVTNAAVGGSGGCPAGSPRATDTIVLAANTTYTGYGKPLLIPSGGGPLVIQGTLSSGALTTGIVGTNYGYPSPNPTNPGVCQYPAAMYAGGSNLTIKNLWLDSDQLGIGHAGICQYSGTLTLDTSEVAYFNQGGLVSSPNTPSNTRNLTIKSTIVIGNTNTVTGGGVSLFGNMTISITGSQFYANESNEGGGALNWNASGTMDIVDTDFHYNDAIYSFGGALNLSPINTSATVNLKGVSIQINTADYHGGGMYVQAFGVNKLTIGKSASGRTSIIRTNSGNGGDGVPFDPAQNTFNTDGNDAYNAIWCTGESDISGLQVAPWTSNTPRLKGDGTCIFSF